MEKLERWTDDTNVEVAVADALVEIKVANARREIGSAKLTMATHVPLKDAEDAEGAEIARAAFKGAKRRSPGSEPQEESLGMEISASRPAKKVKKDFSKALGIERKNSIQLPAGRRTF
jgi:ADP-ribosylglycohydrolase